MRTEEAAASGPTCQQHRGLRYPLRSRSNAGKDGAKETGRGVALTASSNTRKSSTGAAVHNVGQETGYNLSTAGKNEGLLRGTIVNRTKYC